MAWAKCSESVWSHEQDLVKKWKDEIDTLLVYAGLFSAILSAFNVQYYITLQQQAPSAIAPVLIYLSLQLNTLAVTKESMNMTAPYFSVSNQTTTPPAAPLSAVCINSLWLSALIFSLAAATIAMSVKQWLNEYTSRVTRIPLQSVRIWHHRRHGLKKWKVAEIISILPILLQVALVLFVIGLVELLWTLNTIVATIITVQAVLLFLFITCTMVIPAWAVDCPYKSPQAWLIVVLLEWSRGFVRRMGSGIGMLSNKLNYLTGHSTWKEHEEHSVRSSMAEIPLLNDIMILVDADATLMDDALLASVIRPCLNAIPARHVPDALYYVVQNRVRADESGKLAVRVNDSLSTEAVETMAQMTIDTLCIIAEAGFDFQLVHFPPQLLELAREFVSVAVRTQPSILKRLFRLLKFTNTSYGCRCSVISIILDHAIFCDIRCEDLQDLIACIPYTRKNQDVPSLVRVTFAVLYLSQLLSEADSHCVGQNLLETLAALRAQPSPSNRRSSAATPAYNEIEDCRTQDHCFQIFDACLAAADECARPGQLTGVAALRSLTSSAQYHQDIDMFLVRSQLGAFHVTPGEANFLVALSIRRGEALARR